jgi:peptidylprolyl isomerase
MTKVENGNTVKVHYTGKLDNGDVFDSSQNKDPLQFQIGGGQVIKGFEAAILGLGVGEKTTTTIPPEEAYGPYNDKMIMNVEKKQFPENLTLTLNQQLQIPQENGATVIVTVTDIQDDMVTLDGNHPLAGKTLIFDLELVEITG